MARLMKGVAERENRKTVQNFAEFVARERGDHPPIPDPSHRETPTGPAAVKARRLVRADALFEAALGIPLATGGLTGLHSALDLPRPASEPVVTAFGAGLVPFAAMLWRESGRPDGRRLQALAGANALTGALLAGWIAARRDEVEPLGAAVVGGTAAALLALAVAEARVAGKML